MQLYPADLLHRLNQNPDLLVCYVLGSLSEAALTFVRVSDYLIAFVFHGQADGARGTIIGNSSSSPSL